MKTKLYGFTTRGTRVVVGTYATDTAHDKRELSLVIGELAIGGLDCVSGFTPTKRAASLTEIRNVHAG